LRRLGAGVRRLSLVLALGLGAGDPGPLFVNFDRAGKGQRLTGAAVYHIVGWLGAKAGLTVRPQDLRTLSRYRDNRPDLAGKVASLVAAE
jgi:hypothetical protein